MSDVARAGTINRNIDKLFKQPMRVSIRFMNIHLEKEILTSVLLQLFNFI